MYKGFKNQDKSLRKLHGRTVHTQEIACNSFTAPAFDRSTPLPETELHVFTRSDFRSAAANDLMEEKIYSHKWYRY
jgi:hypothetical protein